MGQAGPTGAVAAASADWPGPGEIRMAAVVLPGAPMSGVAALADCFSLARARRDRLFGPQRDRDMHLAMLSLDGRDVDLNDVARLRVDGPFTTAGEFDFVWIPSFKVGSEDMLRELIAANPALITWLVDLASHGTTIGASGAAAALLLAAKLTPRMAIPVSPALEPVFRALFPRYRQSAENVMVDHGNFLFSPGIGQDLATINAVFSRLLSAETSNWLRSVAGLTDEGADKITTIDPLVATARLRLEQRFTTAVSLADLAAELAVSHAVLIRRFRSVMGETPSGYVRLLRLAAAQRMLSRSKRSIESIAIAVGYSDARMFRQMFWRATGSTPSAWRAANRSPPWQESSAKR